MNNWNKWNVFASFPYDEKYREEMELEIAQDSYNMEMILGIAVMAMQAIMAFIFGFRDGGPFISPRRTGYFSLYIFLFIAAFLCVIVRKSLRDKDGRTQLRVGKCFAAVACAWTCGITILDQIGGVGMVVFSYMLPAVAALTVLTFKQSAVIFGSCCTVTNLALLFGNTAGGDSFNILVNSISITLLSILISTRLYNARLNTNYANIVIREQVEEIRKTNELLNHMAITDQLTGIYNRHYLETIVQPRLDALSGKTVPVAGMMIDIDYFKAYNDRYGHQAGDCCLKGIAQKILDWCKSKEGMYAVRFGGEEFFILWIGCAEEAALQAADEFRLKKTGNCADKVTVSIGVAVQGPEEEKSLDELVLRTDLALYRAKDQGRNRTVCFQPDMRIEAGNEPCGCEAKKRGS